MRLLCFLDEPIYAAVHVHIIDPDDPDISEPPINYFLQVEMGSLNAHKLTTRYINVSAFASDSPNRALVK